MKEQGTYHFPTKLDWTLLGAASLYLLTLPQENPTTSLKIAPIPVPITIPLVHHINPTLIPATEAIRRVCADVNAQKGQLRNSYGDCDKEGNLITWQNR